MAMDLNYESIIVIKAAEGDEDAWSLLFRRNFKLVYAFCLQLAKGRVDDAEELTQQAFVIAAKKIHKYNRLKGTFRQWLFGIAKNCFRNFISKKTYSSHSESEIKDIPAKPLNDFFENTLVLEALAQVPIHHRAILEAKYFNKKTMAQLAEEYKVTINTIGLRLRRAREKFKQRYQILQKQECDI